jgi:hypothetical protein
MSMKEAALLLKFQTQRCVETLKAIETEVRDSFEHIEPAFLEAKFRNAVILFASTWQNLEGEFNYLSYQASHSQP